MSWMFNGRLDPEQEDFIENYSKKDGNIWIRGFAGSGKSVLLVHYLKKILKEEPEATVTIVLFTHALIDLYRTGLEESGIKSNIPIVTYYEFCGMNPVITYDYVLCDEVQDLPAKVLFTLKSRSKQVVVAGDSNQSIYDTDPQWRVPVVTPAQVGDILSSKPFELRTIHRLTKSIISVVQKLFPDMNIWGSKRDLTKQDVSIRLISASSEDEEVKYIYSESQRYTAVDKSAVILIPTHKTIQSFINKLILNLDKPSFNWENNKDNYGNLNYYNLNTYFRQNGIHLQYVGNKYGSLSNADRNKDTILMTYHSCKGLDFNNVFIPFLNNNLYIHPTKEKTLFMVAITRSKTNLYLSYFGVPHVIMESFISDCTRISVPDLGKSTNKENQNVFDF